MNSWVRSELETIVNEFPARYRLMALRAAWCAMRFDELAELRRADLDLRSDRVTIRRAVVRADGNHHMAPSTLYEVHYPARLAAVRKDLRWHDLRHTGAVLAAYTGATLAELMGRSGHTTPGAAMRYQHAAAHRDAEITRRLSELAGEL